MKFSIITPVVLSAFLIFSCGGTEEAETEIATEANATEEIIEEEIEEEASLAFDGVDKGDYVLYGHSEITADGETAGIDEMIAEVNNSGSFEGKVKVSIDQVCQKAGCWITFKDNNDESIRVFFRDHFTIPIETASGTEVILYGNAIQDTTSIAMQKHLLEDEIEAGGEVSQEEIDAITEDIIELTFDCESVLVKK
ncbi:DUF4920 domain-containing protein [Crocinitomix catalasitica]|uniref:DUF4920 domain-containing protein n=1 Tax=Crocinitomix catalasitica TaxID=184607 RepID=UPI000686568B|nr:DUF4920 domain-containing protein [Crocinitomix catalasitica]